MEVKLRQAYAAENKLRKQLRRKLLRNLQSEDTDVMKAKLIGDVEQRASALEKINQPPEILAQVVSESQLF